MINLAELQGACIDLVDVKARVAEAIRLKGQSGGLIAKASAEIAGGRFVALHGDVVLQVLEAVLQAHAPGEGHARPSAGVVPALTH